MAKATKAKAAMPKWKPAPQVLVQAYLNSMELFPEAEGRKMFGYPCSFFNGNMFAGLFQDWMVLRLSEADRAALLRRKGARPFEPMPGRPMKEYVGVPPAVVKSKAQLKTWIAKSFEYAKSLPPKPPKARGKRATKSK